jgi:hypothetical protein
VSIQQLTGRLVTVDRLRRPAVRSGKVESSSSPREEDNLTIRFASRPKLDSAGTRNSNDPGSGGVKARAGMTRVTCSQSFCRALAFFECHRIVEMRPAGGHRPTGRLLFHYGNAGGTMEASLSMVTATKRGVAVAAYIPTPEQIPAKCGAIHARRIAEFDERAANREQLYCDRNARKKRQRIEARRANVPHSTICGACRFISLELALKTSWYETTTARQG